MRYLHSICRIGAACRSNDVVPEYMVYVFFIAISGIRPVGAGTHHIRISDGICFGIATVPFHGPVNITGTVIVSLQSKLNPIKICWTGASGFIQGIFEFLNSAFDAVFRICNTVRHMGIFLIKSTFCGLHDIKTTSSGFLHHNGKD